MNSRLSSLLTHWQKEGSRPQESFDWVKTRQNWLKAFPDHENFIALLPAELGRETVRKFFLYSSASTLEKFLVVMIWGYGDRGYGPFRVSKMLSTPNAEIVLQEVYRLCQLAKPKQAYQYLMQNRIRNLGPSFGTKFMCFCTPKDVGAPILDSLVGMWIREFASKDFETVGTNYESWNVKIYSHYWDWIKEHSDAFSCDPDDVELAIFRDAEGLFSSRSQ
jgi:hypothetical protein